MHLVRHVPCLVWRKKVSQVVADSHLHRGQSCNQTRSIVLSTRLKLECCGLDDSSLSRGSETEHVTYGDFEGTLHLSTNIPTPELSRHYQGSLHLVPLRAKRMPGMTGMAGMTGPILVSQNCSLYSTATSEHCLRCGPATERPGPSRPNGSMVGEKG